LYNEFKERILRKMVKHTEMLLLRLLGAIGFQWALEVEVQ
jgi:hypothetical protein